MRLILAEDRAVIWTGSRLECQDLGEAHFGEMLEAIRSALHHVAPGTTSSGTTSSVGAVSKSSPTGRGTA